jgi:hypothetical protein
MNDDRLGSQARVSNVGASSAYPPKLSVIADIGTQPGSAMSRREQVQCAFNNANVVHADRGNLHSERRRYSLNGAELGGSEGNSEIADDSRPRHLRRDLLEQFQPFAAETVLKNHEAGSVAARPGESIDKACADRIGQQPEILKAATRLAAGFGS